MYLLSKIYDKYVLDKPKAVLLAVLFIVLVFGSQVHKFRLDASSDSLVLENDKSVEFYHAASARYGSDDFLIITYTPREKLFSANVLADLKLLRDNLARIPRVKSVLTILNVPLFRSIDAANTSEEQVIHTLEDPETNKDLAKEELLKSDLYRNLLISEDGRTTALMVYFERDETYYRLFNQRNQLREKALSASLSPEEKVKLAQVSLAFKQHKETLMAKESRDIETVRNLMQPHKKDAALYLGGVPMIVADSIAFIENDLVTFGTGVLCFLIVILALAFRRIRWIALPLLVCFCTGVTTIGFLGWAGWPVTIVSSNFISLLLIITLSLSIHLIVRYREMLVEYPDEDQYTLVSKTIRRKAKPCFYTALTTMVAFGSLLVSDIRPIIDFGWMMTIGIAIAFVYAFTLFPAILLHLEPEPSRSHQDITGAITCFFAQFIEQKGHMTLIGFILVSVLCVVGISRLTVENRFIDYYKDSTEIYQGMELIDSALGGTTPLDIIIDAPIGESTHHQNVSEVNSEEPVTADITKGYWFNTFMFEEIMAVHDYLESLDETGKVLSLATTLRVLEKADEAGGELDSYGLAIVHKKLPEGTRDTLFKPYISHDGNQLRFSIRVFESDPNLRRQALLDAIRQHLTTQMGYANAQVHFTGMLVLYNNVLRSLFNSQILTIGVVFFAILIMFVVSFRHVYVAGIAIIPNVVAAVVVLGLMGGLGIPLDIMTITIAAICIGIAVDDTIHYVHRYTKEFNKDRDYWAAVRRSHGSIGRAMYYTTITITLGFSILALSNFVPTIYFGLLTGFSMLIALLADLTLLPLLIVMLKPLGR